MLTLAICAQMKLNEATVPNNVENGNLKMRPAFSGISVTAIITKIKSKAEWLLLKFYVPAQFPSKIMF